MYITLHVCERNVIKNSVNDDDDDDDDDNDDNDDYEPYFQPGSFSEMVTIANLRHAASGI